MKVASHLDKFRRLDALLAQLDPLEDCELWIWTAMNAGVNLLNATLHRLRATQETDSFHTQVEGLYVIPDRARGSLRDAVHAPGDLMHYGQPPLAQAVPAAIERAGAALKIIEDLREPHVRGCEPVMPGAERSWQRAYRECIEALQSVLRD
jgi:hypothetical protein